MTHRDEHLFQIAHQSTELWLKQAGSDLEQALTQTQAGAYVEAAALIERCCQIAQLLLGHLNVLATLDSRDFAAIRQELQGGSGADSPGWKKVRIVSHKLDQSLSCLLPDNFAVPEAQLLPGLTAGIVSCLSALLAWDELLVQWRIKHFDLARHLLGNAATGTQGTSMDELAGLIGKRACPRIWEFNSIHNVMPPDSRGKPLRAKIK